MCVYQSRTRHQQEHAVPRDSAAVRRARASAERERGEATEQGAPGGQGRRERRGGRTELRAKRKAVPRAPFLWYRWRISALLTVYTGTGRLESLSAEADVSVEPSKFA